MGIEHRHKESGIRILLRTRRLFSVSFNLASCAAKNIARLSSSASSAVRRCRVLSQHLTRGQRRMTSNTNAEEEEEVLFSTDKESGGYRQMLLNKPKAHNAINLNMINLMIKDFRAIANDPNIKAVVIENQGEKAFCAGGDVVALTETTKKDSQFPTRFFRGEYTLNHLTGSYNKPIIALLNGITMGGGVGISVHGPFRVATENTVFAMPETQIGLFPDVGGSHFLPRLRGSLGMYLALTGARLKAMDVYFAGIATHYLPRSQLPVFKSELSKLCGPSGQLSKADPQAHCGIIKSLLDDLQSGVEDLKSHEFVLEPHRTAIDRCFDKDSVEGILSALKEEGSDWADNHLKILSKMSPTSLKVSHHQLREGAKLSFADCFKMEYRMGLEFLASKDFYEGVRALLVDKDNSPKWDPPTLEEVSQDQVLRYFAPLGPGREELEL